MGKYSTQLAGAVDGCNASRPSRSLCASAKKISPKVNGDAQWDVGETTLNSGWRVQLRNNRKERRLGRAYLPKEAHFLTTCSYVSGASLAPDARASSSTTGTMSARRPCRFERECKTCQSQPSAMRPLSRSSAGKQGRRLGKQAVEYTNRTRARCEDP